MKWRRSQIPPVLLGEAGVGLLGRWGCAAGELSPDQEEEDSSHCRVLRSPAAIPTPVQGWGLSAFAFILSHFTLKWAWGQQMHVRWW